MSYYLDNCQKYVGFICENVFFPREIELMKLSIHFPDLYSYAYLFAANFISNGMNLFGQLRRKTPTTSTSSGELKSASSPTTSSSENSMSSGAYWECQQSQALNSTATTANVSELIEMTSFKTVPLAEGDLKHQSGKGHDFVGVASFNPTWCDLCRDLIWGLYDTGSFILHFFEKFCICYYNISNGSDVRN